MKSRIRTRGADSAGHHRHRRGLILIAGAAAGLWGVGNEAGNGIAGGRARGAAWSGTAQSWVGLHPTHAAEMTQSLADEPSEQHAGCGLHRGQHGELHGHQRVPDGVAPGRAERVLSEVCERPGADRAGPCRVL